MTFADVLTTAAQLQWSHRGPTTVNANDALVSALPAGKRTKIVAPVVVTVETDANTAKPESIAVAVIDGKLLNGVLNTML